MKRFISISLLFCIVFTTVGFYPVFLALQLQTRQEIKLRIKQGIPEDEIHKIIFTTNAKIDWVRPGKEFRLNNEMFDIVRQEISRGQLIFYCVNDKEEKALFANLDELVKKQMQDENSTSGNFSGFLLKIFAQIYIITESFNLELNTLASKVTFHFESKLTVVFLETESPPPDLG